MSAPVPIALAGVGGPVEEEPELVQLVAGEIVEGDHAVPLGAVEVEVGALLDPAVELDVVALEEAGLGERPRLGLLGLGFLLGRFLLFLLGLFFLAFLFLSTLVAVGLVGWRRRGLVVAGGGRRARGVRVGIPGRLVLIHARQQGAACLRRTRLRKGARGKQPSHAGGADRQRQVLHGSFTPMLENCGNGVASGLSWQVILIGKSRTASDSTWNANKSGIGPGENVR